jgi:hypothetical protein
MANIYTTPFSYRRHNIGREGSGPHRRLRFAADAMTEVIAKKQVSPPAGSFRAAPTSRHRAVAAYTPRWRH